jgi:hypothetical protein
MADFTTELIAFLNARLDEDAYMARRAGDGDKRPHWVYDREKFRVLTAEGQARMIWPDGHPEPDRWVIASHREEGSLLDVDGEHIARHDPARVMADVVVKRQIIELAKAANDHEDVIEGEFSHNSRARERGEEVDPRVGDSILMQLALLYADHPDYREEWRP